MYASDDYQAVARAEIEQLDHLLVTRGGDGRLEALSKTFNQATRLEIAFWQMGLDVE